MSLNKVMIIGNLGADPEMRFTPNGDAITNFNVAVNESWTSNGEKKDRTEWFRVVCWNKLAETAAQYLTKGRQVFVEGRLQTRSWEDQSGQKRYSTEVVASTVRFLGERGEPREQEEAFVPEPDDLPF